MLKFPAFFLPSDNHWQTVKHWVPVPSKYGVGVVAVREVPAILSWGTFRSDYEYEFINVYPVCMRDCVRLSRQLVLSSKSRNRLDANYEIFNKISSPEYEFTAGAKAS